MRKPGDRSVVRIDGIDYPAVIDDGGILRFESNGIVKDMHELLSEDSRLDMNEIFRRYVRGHYSLDELRALYRMIGYSVYGYWEVFCWGANTEGRYPSQTIEVDGEIWDNE